MAAEYTYSEIFNMAINAVKSITPEDDLDEMDEDFIDEVLDVFISKVGRAIRAKKRNMSSFNEYDDNFKNIANYLIMTDNPDITFRLQKDLKDYFLFLGDDREKVKFKIDVEDFGKRKYSDDDEEEEEDDDMSETEYGFKQGGLILENKYKPTKYIIKF
jgi:hypothetical protein